MITLLSRIFIRGELPDDQRRAAYGKLSAFLGIGLNLLLFAGKLFAGLISGSIAIMADAFNNLSDAGSSLVSLVSFRISERKPDADHPYGHGRVEYLAGFIISVIIMIMAYELIRDSIAKILHPEQTAISPLIILILILSILVKCYMAYYNSSLGRRLDAAALRATAIDSLSDCAATSVVLLCTILSYACGWHIDGYAGLLVGFFILAAGLKAARDVINPLLGEPPTSELVDRIESIVRGYSPDVLGVHDLMVHDYGPGRLIISLHVEVPAERNILELHDVLDNLEDTLCNELGCVATLHMDPIVTNDPRVDNLHSRVGDILADIDSQITMHDFRVVFGPSHTNLIFDIVLPFDYPVTESALCEQINELVHKRIGSRCNTVVSIDRSSVRRR